MSDTVQLGLLAWTPPAPAPKASEQDRQLARVEGKIAESIIEFLRRRLAGAPEFHGAELAAHVQRECGGAPASAERIMRKLRSTGQVQVELVSRAGSLYRVLGVTG